MSKTDEMRKIRDEILVLKESPLYAERVKNKVFPVIGEGSHDAKIMFIGEAPGKNEAATGRPFCGAAGKILDQLLTSVGIDRKDVYVTNIVKDRPPFNRDPLPDEMQIYGPFLDRQIDIIQPQVIAALGRFSMDYIMRKFGLAAELAPISQIHGQAFESKASYGPVMVIPLYHPAVAIYNQASKDTLTQDFQILKKYK
ncbi:MAG: uracil-DNA glycosylase [Candidatus Yanofskybacteria bacterium RIFCSPLOWO2_01_FULL_49_17]|uniref:Type-4 uracil-DNA glycosylase n=1 Tax=Candidatus Yanofskybacteria bacterium RIFCSPLOWO2_01_FULL_49_17 TaxID=1802700 RepID=A0A1F8GQL0_9BACT|nr:MAG: uracil-DNA glycosylase [Candidatus Yanofskybacteria bacterium RIFCSPLOWO2_01_FULL_49_17]